MNEADFIAALRGLPLHPGARELTDDCAVLAIGGETLVLTHDTMAEGTHFRSDADLADVAWKLVASNLSDLAAKGAVPIGVLLGHTLGHEDVRFLHGLREALEVFEAPLLGGDTIAVQGVRSFGLTAIGRATHVPVPARSGAQAGDTIWITGPVGRAMLGFIGAEEHRAAFDRPIPRLAEGQALSPHVSAMMDVSDGLLLDSWRMARASRVTFAIDTHAVPVADPAQRDACMRWGDDYELLFTTPRGTHLPVAAHRIGTVAPRTVAPLIVGDMAYPDPETLGFQHG
ncbi:thiamine-phosphate kinase [Erythrobacter sp. R86502]|uniref:thiamine-phosphate kinase n=1 Tax=Erythrobacter sp. R86502 TaxID=3093846 RepID=UPI0036D31342